MYIYKCVCVCVCVSVCVCECVCVCVISPVLFVLVMEMISRSAEVNTNEITSPFMNFFKCRNSCCRIRITHETNGDPPAGALQMGCDGNKAREMPQFINN